MPRTQRFVQYIQQLAYESLSQHEARDEREERPADALPGAPSPAPNYATWNATSFASYVPFRVPTDS